MTTFKNKNLKQILSDKRGTLDSKHNEITKQFKENHNTLSPKRKRLNKLRQKYNEINGLRMCDLDDTQIKEKYKINKEIKKLENEINDIETNKQEKDYLLKTSHILFEYYDTETNTNTKAKEDTKSVVDYFNNNNSTSNKITKYIEKKTESNKAELLDEYLSIVDSNYIKSTNNKNSHICSICNIEKTLIQSEGVLVCTKCGDVEFTIIDSDKPSYKDPPPETTFFAYKRINHFNEWLAQFQAKETTDIPKTVIDQLFVEIKKERITNMADLTLQKIRDYLKKLKLNKYYEHVPHIINRLNGLPPPIMNRETEEKLRIMFKEIQGPFMKVCPKGRKNFLSYSYVLHKFVQLLSMDEFLPCFPLLKSREKLHQQDIIWKEICKELNWEFIKSI